MLVPKSTIVTSMRLRAIEATPDKSVGDSHMAAIEREVLESTRAKLDLQRVTRTLLDDDPESSQPLVRGWQVAVAAGSAGGITTFVLFHNLLLSGIVCVSIFFAANGDPMEEDSAAGALARIVGRVTLQSVQASQPKVRAMARAALRGEDEVTELRARASKLEQEISDLRLWKERRLAVDEALPDFSLDDLKDKARQNGLLVGGTKAQLLMRLVEADLIRLS